MRRWVEWFNDTEPLSLCLFWPACIIATHGYDFRKGHLSHQLAPKAKLVVGVRQVGEGLEGRVAGTRDHRVDVAYFLEHSTDGRRAIEVSRYADNT